MYAWNPEGGFHDAVWSGTLAVEGPCLYVYDIVGHHSEEHLPDPPDGPQRAYLRLPEPLTRYDRATGDIWVAGNGPMSTGDRVTLHGSEGWQRQWSAVNDDGGMHTFTYLNVTSRDLAPQCAAHLSFWAASMSPAAADNPYVPRASQLPGLGLYTWSPDRMTHAEGSEGGILIIEPPCVYYLQTTQVADDWDNNLVEPTLYHLEFPRQYVRYDPRTNSLWHRSNGPIQSGDEVEMSGGGPGGDSTEPYEAAGCSAADAVYHGVYMAPR